MIASLRMYEWPDMRGALDRYWQLVNSALRDAGLPAPKFLNTTLDEQAAWMRPDLCLAQTCGMPYRTQLHDSVALIGTPDFAVPDCPAGYYNSIFVTNIQDNRAELTQFDNAVFAYNMAGSQSGLAAAFFYAQELGFWFAKRVASGGHAKSAKMVANGDAEITCLDAVSWRLIQRYADFSDKLRVVAQTKPTPGLPYISATGADQKKMFQAIDHAIQQINDDDAIVLGIKGLVWISPDTYLDVPNPPVSATKGDCSLS